VKGLLKTPASALAGTYANGKGFKIGAAADIDGDGDADLLTVDQNGVITVVFDDLV
jgi:hypothetical protein